MSDANLKNPAQPQIPHILGLGLDPTIQASIKSVLPDAMQLQTLSLLDPFEKIIETVKNVDLVLLQWDGKGQRAHAFLSKLGTLSRDWRAVTYAIKPDPKLEPLNDRQSQACHISGWIEFPARAFEIQRLVHDLKPEGKDSSETVEAALEQLDGRRLKLRTPSQIDPETVVHGIMNSLKQEPENSPASALFRTVALYHPDEAFVVELERWLKGELTADTVALKTPEDIASLVQAKVDALIILEDGSCESSRILLEHLSEARQVAGIPTLLLLTDRVHAPKVAQSLGWLFFDVAAIYDRRKGTLERALKTLKTTVSDPESPRGLLERLRRPLRPEAPPELRRMSSLEVVQALTDRLAQKPGKRYWGYAESIPYLLLAGKKPDAEAALAAMTAIYPDAFSTYFMRHMILRFGNGKQTVTKEIVSEALNFRHFSRERLYRVGQLLARSGETEALGDLLDGCHERPAFKDCPELHFLAARYYELVKCMPAAGAHYACAARATPRRAEFLEALATYLSTIRRDDRAVMLYQQIARLRGSSWDSRHRHARTLLRLRRLKEARQVIETMLKASPNNKEALALKALVEGKNR